MLKSANLITDRGTGERRPVLEGPCYRIVQHSPLCGQTVFTLDEVWLDAQRRLPVYGRCLVYEGSLRECYQALPAGVHPLPYLPPTPDGLITEYWW